MTDSNVFFLNAHGAMQRAGIDVDEIYRRLGISPQQLLRPGTRLAHDHQARFWSTVEDVTGDKEIGLHLCPFLSPFAGEVVNHLFVSSATLEDGCTRVLRYIRLLSDHLTLRLVVDGEGCDAALAGTLGNECTPRHTEITFLYGMIQAIHHASGLFKPTRIELMCPAGADETAFMEIFGCPVTFGAVETRCHFPKILLALPFPHADPEVAVAHETVAQRKMRKVLKHDMVTLVRRAIASRLEDSPCSLESVASKLGRTTRSLRKELLDTGTSFNQLMAEERQSLAKRLLANSTESIERIARLTGFSERSAFFRAFKSWTGFTPMQYRNSRQSKHV